MVVVNLVDKLFRPTRFFTPIKSQIFDCEDVKDGIEQLLGYLDGLGGKKISILRFYGHGLPGMQIFGANDNPHPPRNQQISFSHKHGLRGGHQLQRLRGHFGHPSRIEFRGCLIASGGVGKRFMWLVSDLLNVRVRASSVKQGANMSRWTPPVFDVFGEEHLIEVPDPEIAQ